MPCGLGQAGDEHAGRQPILSKTHSQVGQIPHAIRCWAFNLGGNQGFEPVERDVHSGASGRVIDHRKPLHPEREHLPRLWLGY